MKAVIQKVSSAETIVDGELVSSIKKGIVIFLGIAIDDGCLLYTSPSPRD